MSFYSDYPKPIHLFPNSVFLHLPPYRLSPSFSPLIFFSSFSLVIVILFSFFLPSPLIFYSGWAPVCVINKDLKKIFFPRTDAMITKMLDGKNTAFFTRRQLNCLKKRLLLLFCCLKFDIWTAMEETRLLRFD